MMKLINPILLVFWVAAVSAHQPVHRDDAGQLSEPAVAAELSSHEKQTFPVTIRLYNEQGKRTSAMLSLARAGSWQQIPLEQQFLSNALHPLRSSERRQWRGKFPIHSKGETVLMLASGHYTLTVGKGLEYYREKHNFEVAGKQTLSVDVRLRRWVDLPAQGWWSGDPHVHVSRPSLDKDRDILAAAMAEDIHITSTLEMGDVDEMHFPGRSRGLAGRIREGSFYLVPGQEEPRTNELGHSIVLNTQQLYRDKDNYYRYDQLFARARDDGAVAGLAHYFYAKFHSYRAGALLLPDGLVDFVELLDDSDILSPGQYYDALNLGFKLPVSAGSDYPWGAHIGDQRTYVQLAKDQALSPEAWYQGLKEGRSYVTQGPILRFTINGQGIGSAVNVRSGDTLRIRAEAQAPPYIGAAKQLALISMGEKLIEVSRADRSESPLKLSHALSVNKSQWFVVVAQGHNGALAHSSPIYVSVDSRPARLEGPALKALVAKQIAVVRGASGKTIPLQHRTREFEDWLRRIEAYYIHLGGQEQEQ
ncbi:MAG: CehA/McbA family metallohydrolase [Halieaceae bacterium]|jgi:hypothetical protein|nr:CehA/McbA family metallohydrolase [Halieaceae bacterium]